MASRGFAGGLADGINNGMQLHMQKKYYDGLSDDRRRKITLEEEKAAKAAKGTDFTEFDSMPLFPTMTGAPKVNMAPQQPIMMDSTFTRPKGFAEGGLVMLAQHKKSAGKNRSAKYSGGLSMLKKGGK